MTPHQVSCLLFVVAALVGLSQSKISQTDNSALLSIRTATIYQNWNSKNGWGDPVGNPDPCNTTNNWYGVICSTIGGEDRVVTLNLGFNNLGGTVPPEITQLTELQYLYLQNNNLGGGLSPDLPDLAKLKIIYLMNNKFSGRIPGKWVTFPSIQKLYLDNNQITGTIPAALGDLTTLTQFQISNNSISGTFPPELGKMVQLESLYFDHNQMGGVLPTSMKNCTNLKFLRLNNNQFVGQIPEEWAALRALAESDLSSNQLGCFFPDFLRGGNFIWNVTGNQFYCPIPSDVQGVDCAKTQFLSVSPPTVILDAANPGTTPFVTIVSTGVQPVCSDLEIRFGNIVTLPIGLNSTAVYAQVPYQTPGQVTITMGIRDKRVAGCNAPFTIRAKCQGASGPDGCGNGTCDTLKGVCTCPQGTFGATCDSDCPKDCSGRGKCFLVGFIPACNCIPGFLGADCETALCPSQSCNGNGICDLSQGKCVCNPGWEGADCSRRPPCPNCNNGDCYFVASVTDALCDCRPGWYGEFCDQQPDSSVPVLPIALGAAGCFLLIVILVVVGIFCRFKKPNEEQKHGGGL